jgi:Fe-S cluster assembly scaffold protein SufB
MNPFPQDLIRNVAASTGLPEATASRVVADVAAYFGETVDQFVVRRHAELQGAGRKRNDDIWPQLAAELKARRFRAGDLTERQLRRIVYG